MPETMDTAPDAYVTIVVNDTANEGLVAEHGLALYIETAGIRILFDTGQRGALKSNARVLGIDLAAVDVLVLSHGHYDHTGGIARISGQAPHLEVYCHPGIVQPRYAIREGKPRSIGMPGHALEALDRLPPERLHWIQEPLMLTETIGLTGPVPRVTGYEDTGGPFYLDPEGACPDLIEDDLALWIQTDEGLVVCMGCAHAGLVNTLHHIRDLNEGARIRAVVGGFHLLNAGPPRLQQTVEELKRLEPDILVPCHCTGKSAVALLCDAMGEHASPGVAGATYRF